MFKGFYFFILSIIIFSACSKESDEMSNSTLLNRDQSIDLIKDNLTLMIMEINSYLSDNNLTPLDLKSEIIQAEILSVIQKKISYDKIEVSIFSDLALMHSLETELANRFLKNEIIDKSTKKSLPCTSGYNIRNFGAAAGYVGCMGTGNILFCSYSFGIAVQLNEWLYEQCLMDRYGNKGEF